ncbi:MAG: glutathione peroxidase [Paracoccaceae bacterium]
MLRILTVILAFCTVIPVWAAPLDTQFPNIDGGTLELSDWQGQPILVVNTASQCGFTGQYEGLQALYDRYRGQGLVVLAVPSDDFNQELGSGAEVKEFCDMAFGLDMPMADISRVKGRKAHPFYKEIRRATGFQPNWNFNKILIDRDGKIAGTWRSSAKPLGSNIVQAIEAALLN